MCSEWKSAKYRRIFEMRCRKLHGVDHLKLCQVPDAMGNYWKQPFATVAQSEEKGRKFGKFRAIRNREQFNRRVQLVDEQAKEVDDENDTVLNVEGV